MVLVPIFIFCLFEWALKIELPKSITEPLFYPIWDIMYSEDPLCTAFGIGSDCQE